MNSVTARLAAVCVAMALTQSACGGHARNGADPSSAMAYLGLHPAPPTKPFPKPTGPDDLRLPLDAYSLDAGQQLKIFEAERSAEQACIHRYLPGVALGAFGRVVFLPATRAPLAYLTPGQAARYGYHDPAVMALAARDSVPLSGRLLDEADKIDYGTIATFGGRPVPRGGCDVVGTQAVGHGISLSLLPGNNADPATLPGVTRLIDHVVILADSRITAVDAKWSACMAGHGHHYPRPQVAVNDRAWNARTIKGSYRTSVTAAEVRTAVADVTCRESVNLYPVYWAVAAAYQLEWMSDPKNMAMARVQRTADQTMLARAASMKSLS